MIPCYKSLKIIFDRLLALLLIFSFSPLLVALSILIFIDQHSLLFVQKRPGLLAVPFRLLKFKTIHNDGKITHIGRVLRTYSLDELPQLFNILNGDMSFIGPRPLLMEYLPLYSEEHSKRHWVLPGLSGLAQVSGGNRLTWKSRLDLDCKYVHTMSFWLDVKIILKTVQLTIQGREDTAPIGRLEKYHHG